MLISKFSPIGQLNKPLCGLVLHYGEAGHGALPNEAAWLCASQSSLVNGPPVKVFVSHSSLNTMRKVYAPLGSKVTVEPLYFKRKELDAHAVLSMMAIGSSESAPLYMQIILVSTSEVSALLFFLPNHRRTSSVRWGRTTTSRFSRSNSISSEKSSIQPNRPASNNG